MKGEDNGAKLFFLTDTGRIREGYGESRVVLQFTSWASAERDAGVSSICFLGIKKKLNIGGCMLRNGLVGVLVFKHSYRCGRTVYYNTFLKVFVFY